MSRLGTSRVGKARSTKSSSIAEARRSRPKGLLNLPARSLTAGVNRRSRYASCSTVLPSPKSGIARKSTFLNSMPSGSAHTRRITKVSAPCRLIPSANKSGHPGLHVTAQLELEGAGSADRSEKPSRPAVTRGAALVSSTALLTLDLAQPLRHADLLIKRVESGLDGGQRGLGAIGATGRAGQGQPAAGFRMWSWQALASQQQQGEDKSPVPARAGTLPGGGQFGLELETRRELRRDGPLVGLLPGTGASGGERNSDLREARPARAGSSVAAILPTLSGCCGSRGRSLRLLQKHTRDMCATLKRKKTRPS